MKILLLDDVHTLFKTSFSFWGWEVVDGQDWTLEDLNTRVHLFNGIIIRSKFKLNSSLLSKAKKLKFIGRPGSGLEHIDTDFCRLNDIYVFSSPEGNRDAVGEHIMGMLLMLLNHLKKADKEVRNGKWIREGNRGVELKGKTVGIIGYGKMGSSFAEKLSGFGVNVIAYDKYKVNYSSSFVKEVSLSELQYNADIVSLHTPLTEETIGMVDKQFFAKFKKPIIFINSARGRSVILKDLIDALNKGDVVGACLDVLEVENFSFELADKNKKLILEQLFKKENVLFSPHIAGWTFEAKQKMAQVIIEKVENVFKK